MKQLAKLLLAALFVAMMPFTAYAAEVKPVHMENITVTNTIVDGIPTASRTFEFELTAQDGAPLPSETVVSVAGSGSAAFGEITYTEADVYHYKLRQLTANVIDYDCDETVYDLTVYVVYDADGALKIDAVYATANSNPDVKVAALNFNNCYIMQQTSPHTGEDCGLPYVQQAQQAASNNASNGMAGVRVVLAIMVAIASVSIYVATWFSRKKHADEA